MELLGLFNVWLQIFSNICIVAITIYTAALQFWYNSIKYLGFEYSSTLFYGNKIMLQLQNVSLSSVSINKIHMLVKQDSVFLVKKYSVPLLVEGRQHFQVEMDPIAYDVDSISKPNVLFTEFTNGNSIALFRNTPLCYRLRQWSKNFIFYWSLKIKPKSKLMSLNTIGCSRIKYKDVYLSNIVKFVLIIEHLGKEKTIFITKNGLLSEVLFDGENSFNAIGEGDYNFIKSRLDEVFSFDESIRYKLYTIESVASTEQVIPLNSLII